MVSTSSPGTIAFTTCTPSTPGGDQSRYSTSIPCSANRRCNSATNGVSLSGPLQVASASKSCTDRRLSTVSASNPVNAAWSSDSHSTIARSDRLSSPPSVW